jgi:DNA primase
MEISTIKQSLSLQQVLEHYHLPIDKNKMLRCPFHEDKTASLQVNLEKDFYKCHACGKKGDQIQFVEDFEKLTKHEALKKCTELISPLTPKGGTSNIMQNSIVPPLGVRGLFLEKMFTSFRKGIFNSVPAREYCKARKLDYSKIEIGFNSGQFHQGERRNEELITNSLATGLLIDNHLKSSTGGKAYSVFGKHSLVFPLKNCHGQTVSLYFRSILTPSFNEENKMPAVANRHFYLKNRNGLYPNYPNLATKKLILTESIIDCASLLQIDEINKNYSLLACYGTNGLNEEIQKAIKELQELEEIIFAFDNDQAGKEAVVKYANQLLMVNDKLLITQIEFPNKDINETLQLHSEEIFLELLENRKSVIARHEANPTEKITEEPKNLKPSNAIEFLKRKDLLKNLNIEIGKSGIVGEENSRLLLFLIIISYVNKNPIHAIVQGSSGSGKTHIISKIADLMPQEDVLRFTRITESSLYNWGEFDLFQKIIIIEDLDGLKEDALYALRELISNQFLSSSVSIKDKKGNNKSTRKEVKGQFSSLSATTKGETYEDNMSRSFLIAVDESKEQTQRIIENQNKRNAGEIDPATSQKVVNFIQQIVRNLKYYEVINPYATQLQLPEKVHKIRRLNEMYQSVIKQVTFLNQHQRKLAPSPSDKLRTEQFAGEGFLITEIEDIEQATEILFESIILKVDELDGSLRQFFERLKKYVKNDGEEFILRDIRQDLSISKTQVFRYIQTLLELEYIKQIGGYSNKGIRYKICYWDNYQKLRAEIKDYLMNQIEVIKQKKAT